MPMKGNVALIDLPEQSLANFCSKGHTANTLGFVGHKVSAAIQCCHSSMRVAIGDTETYFQRHSGHSLLTHVLEGHYLPLCSGWWRKE